MSGYTHCSCHECFEIAIGEPGEALCHDCETAGCDDSTLWCQVDKCNVCGAGDGINGDCKGCESSIGGVL